MTDTLYAPQPVTAPSSILLLNAGDWTHVGHDIVAALAVVDGRALLRKQNAEGETLTWVGAGDTYICGRERYEVSATYADPEPGTVAVQLVRLGEPEHPDTGFCIPGCLNC